MSYLKPLITLDFWFNPNPPSLSTVGFAVLGILILAIFACGVAMKIVGRLRRANPPLHRVLARAGRAEITIAVIGAVLFFLDYEMIMFVSARFWWLLLAVGAIVWKVFIIKDALKRYPAEKKALAERMAREKYLP